MKLKNIPVISEFLVLKRHYNFASIGLLVYSLLRLSIFPTKWFSGLAVNLTGDTLCLGCGYGVLETLFALSNPGLRIVASDVEETRITAARKAIRDVPNLNFEVKDATGISDRKKYDLIIFADLLHHLRKGEQEKLLDRLWEMLNEKGTLIMKDVDTRPRWKYWWNYLHDSLMAGQPLNYKPSEHYINYFNKKSANVRHKIFNRKWLPYSHYALVISKKQR